MHPGFQHSLCKQNFTIRCKQLREYRNKSVVSKRDMSFCGNDETSALKSRRYPTSSSVFRSGQWKRRGQAVLFIVRARILYLPSRFNSKPTAFRNARVRKKPTEEKNNRISAEHRGPKHKKKPTITGYKNAVRAYDLTPGKRCGWAPDHVPRYSLSAVYPISPS